MKKKNNLRGLPTLRLQAAKDVKSGEAESLDQQIDKVRSSFHEQNKPTTMPRMEMWVREVYPDHVIVYAGDDGMFKVGYEVDAEGQVKFAKRDKWEKVQLTYVPVKASMTVQLARKSEKDSNAPEGTNWDVTIISAGVSKTNPPFYVTLEALTASLNVFEGAKVYATFDGDSGGHKKDPNKKVPREIVGVLSKPYIDGNELRAKLSILPSEEWLRDNLLFLEKNNQLHVYQLSIDSHVAAEKKYVEAVQGDMLTLQQILKADLDIVGEAGAGGKFNKKLAASKHTPSTTGVAMQIKQKLLALFSLFYPDYLVQQNVDWLKVNENELYSHLLQADKPQPCLHLPDGMDERLLDERIQKYQAAAVRGAEDPNKKPGNGDQPPAQGAPGIGQRDLQAAVDPLKEEIRALRLSNCQNMLAAKLGDSNLPKTLKDKIEQRWKGKVFTEAEIDQDIKDVREMFAAFAQPRVDNMGMDVQMGASQIEKIQAGVDAMFLTSKSGLDPVAKGSDEYKQLFGQQDPFRSVREVYVLLTSDCDVTGVAPRNLRILASLETSDWVNVISNAMNKRLARDYNVLKLDSWRAFVDIRDGVRDFKEQQTVRYGGYPNLPIVGERGTYLPLASPTDEKAVWTPAKRGGTEDLTREMIKNDDVSAAQRIPTRLARAAAQTLHEFIYDFVRPGVNPTIYDGLALYHATHANTGTAALGTDGVALNAGRLRMRKQTQKDNSKPLGLRAGYILGPSDLEEVGYKLLTPAAEKNNTVPAYLQQLGVTFIPVEYWTDATDWVLAARREDIVGLEIGFVDGQETPQLFVSDLPNNGSFFTNDVITHKIRHEYGGAINDFRAFDGSIVAG